MTLIEPDLMTEWTGFKVRGLDYILRPQCIIITDFTSQPLKERLETAKKLQIRVFFHLRNNREINYCCALLKPLKIL